MIAIHFRKQLCLSIRVTMTKFQKQFSKFQLNSAIVLVAASSKELFKGLKCQFPCLHFSLGNKTEFSRLDSLLHSLLQCLGNLESISIISNSAPAMVPFPNQFSCVSIFI